MALARRSILTNLRFPAGEKEATRETEKRRKGKGNRGVRGRKRVIHRSAQRKHCFVSFRDPSWNHIAPIPIFPSFYCDCGQPHADSTLSSIFRFSLGGSLIRSINDDYQIDMHRKIFIEYKNMRRSIVRVMIFEQSSDRIKINIDYSIIIRVH